MQIVENQNQGVDLTLAEQRVLDGVEHALPALRGVEGLPDEILDWHVQKVKKGW